MRSRRRTTWYSHRALLKIPLRAHRAQAKNRLSLILRSRQINRPPPLMTPRTKMIHNPTLAGENDRHRSIRRRAIFGALKTDVSTGDAIDSPIDRTNCAIIGNRTPGGQGKPTGGRMTGHMLMIKLGHMHQLPPVLSLSPRTSTSQVPQN